MTPSRNPTAATATPLLALFTALMLAYPALAQTSAPAAGDKEPVTAPKADTPAKDGKDANQLNRVEVIGNNSEAEQRRTSTASRIVIGKEDIERYGDSSVSEVLKRLPGVTTGGRPGRGGDVRMRGMGGGYTQILLNGERMPPGFSLDNLPPDQLERIEVMRAPTAEFGARAVAGTINIVLKEALKKTANEVRLGSSIEGDQASSNASWTRNDKIGEAIPYTFTVSLNRSNTRDDNESRTVWTDINTGALVLDQHATNVNFNKREGLNLNARVQIPLSPGESLTIMPIAIMGSGNSTTSGRLNDAARLDVRLNGGGSRNDTRSLRQELDNSNTVIRLTDDSTDTRENNWSFNGKLSYQMENEHSLVGGLEFDSNVRNQGRTTLQNGLPILTEFGDDINASSARVATYVQDEWNPSKQVSAYAGLRWESITTKSDSSSYAVSNTSSVLTPLLHATWKPDEKSRNQWRSSLTRSYKAASLQELIARPGISQRYPTGANEVSSPDRAGNPNLNPELASGFEIAYEHYLSKGGLISANFFYRRISDLIRSVVALETVSWSDQQRWVSRPQNVGNATAQGIELEAKVRLDEIFDNALPVALRTNLSVFDSKVDQVPGPNNRLEGQPKGTANIGLDYKLRNLPISFGGTVNITPGYDLQVSGIQSSSMGTKVVADAFVLWSVDRETQVRFNVNNLAPRDYLSTSTALNDTQRQVTESNNPSRLNWGVRLELKL
ncbi:MAG: TonB-dependent receptor [Burkholderiales bacterium PBB4]|nr:MAG: TonB-dependent receptor [Burkholderiales bacterium PBB4]